MQRQIALFVQQATIVLRNPQRQFYAQLACPQLLERRYVHLLVQTGHQQTYCIQKLQQRAPQELTMSTIQQILFPDVTHVLPVIPALTLLSHHNPVQLDIIKTKLAKLLAQFAQQDPCATTQTRLRSNVPAILVQHQQLTTCGLQSLVQQVVNLLQLTAQLAITPGQLIL